MTDLTPEQIAEIIEFAEADAIPSTLYTSTVAHGCDQDDIEGYP